MPVCFCLLLPLHAAAAHALSVAVLVAAGLSDALFHVVLIPLILMSPSASSPSATTSSTASYTPPSPRTSTQHAHHTVSTSNGTSTPPPASSSTSPPPMLSAQPFPHFSTARYLVFGRTSGALPTYYILLSILLPCLGLQIRSFSLALRPPQVYTKLSEKLLSPPTQAWFPQDAPRSSLRWSLHLQ